MYNISGFRKPDAQGCFNCSKCKKQGVKCLYSGKKLIGMKNLIKRSLLACLISVIIFTEVPTRCLASEESARVDMVRGGNSLEVSVDADMAKALSTPSGPRAYTIANKGICQLSHASATLPKSASIALSLGSPRLM